MRSCGSLFIRLLLELRYQYFLVADFLSLMEKHWSFSIFLAGLSDILVWWRCDVHCIIVVWITLFNLYCESFFFILSLGKHRLSYIFTITIVLGGHPLCDLERSVAVNLLLSVITLSHVAVLLVTMIVLYSLYSLRWVSLISEFSSFRFFFLHLGTLTSRVDLSLFLALWSLCLWFCH